MKITYLPNRNGRQLPEQWSEWSEAISGRRRCTLYQPTTYQPRLKKPLTVSVWPSEGLESFRPLDTNTLRVFIEVANNLEWNRKAKNKKIEKKTIWAGDDKMRDVKRLVGLLRQAESLSISVPISLVCLSVCMYVCIL